MFSLVIILYAISSLSKYSSSLKEHKINNKIQNGVSYSKDNHTQEVVNDFNKACNLDKQEDCGKSEEIENKNF